MTLLTYTLPQLQEALQETSAEAARNRITLLQNEHGFPRRLPGFTARWSRPAVDAWFAAWDAPAASTMTGSSEDAAITPLRQMLEKAYA